jgi:CheY-like chemotaxis protein
MKQRILVVEDHEDIREILRSLLTYHNFEVVDVPTAEEMFERLGVVDPDLIVLDIRLPGMDGCQALGTLRGMGFEKPIFYYSEYYDLFAEAIRNCKPDAFFPKSKGPLLLLEGIQQRLTHLEQSN